MFILFVMLSAFIQPNEIPRTVDVKQSIDVGEAVEFRLEGNADGDVISWLVLSPGDVEIKTFKHDTSFIIDPPVDFTGRIRVLCRVTNFDTREIIDLEAFTMVGVSADQGVEVAVSQPSAPIKTLRDISRETAPEFDGQVYGIWKRAADQLARGGDAETVSEIIVKELNAAKVTGWKRHFTTVFESLNGQPAEMASTLYQEVADGIGDLKEK